MILELALVAQFWLIRHTDFSPCLRSEAGPYATMAECNADIMTYANREGLECVRGRE